MRYRAFPRLRSVQHLRTWIHALTVAALLAGLIPPPLLQTALPSAAAKLVEALIPETPVALAADTVNGAVFRDYNADGVHDTNEPGLAGVTVTAYDASGAVAATAPSGADGSYTLPGLTAGVEYRLEFTLPTDGSMDALSPSAMGANNSSSVQFVDGGATGVDAGFYNPTEYAVNPLLFTSVMNGFDVINLAGQSFGDAKSSAAVAYNASGTSPTQTYIVPASEKGATYGVAWQPSSQRLFVSSYIKAMAGLGPTDTPGAAGGVTTGGIYLITPIDATNATATLFIDLQPIIDTGANPHPLPTDTCTSALFAGATNGRCWIHEDVLAEVGTVGLGDLDFNADGSVLYTVNLNTREVVAIPVGIPAVAPAAGNIVSYAVPTAECANPADAQPFALAAHADDPDKMYVGVTCTAYSSQDPAELWAWVYEFDSGDGSFTPIFNSTLNYARPKSVGLWGNCTNANCPATWRPWQDDLSLMHVVAQSSASTDPIVLAHPQPMVTDIVFDQGDLVLGIRDRVADQVGDRAGKPGDNTNGRLWTAYSGGDMVRACADGAGGWTMEANAVCGGVTGAGPGTNEGPGGGEYYRDTFSANGGTHPELNLGGLAQAPGFSSIAATTYDATAIFEGAIRKWNNATGAQLTGARIYRENGAEWEYFSKTNGLGDLELLNEAAPIEVGNRVWNDTDSDGIQDPGEAPIAGVTVTLHDSSGALIASAVTDANGNYIFSNGSGTDTASAKYGLTALTANTADFALRIDTTQGALSGLLLTTANADSSANGDLRDSDGVLDSTTAQVVFATGVAGVNNHTYDFGFVAPPPEPAALRIVKEVNGGSVSEPFTVTVTGPNSYNTTVSVTPGAPTELTNLAAGQYTVVEATPLASSAPVGYQWAGISYAPAGGLITLSGGMTGTITVTNYLGEVPVAPTGVLTVTKTVDWNGNTANGSQQFAYTIDGPNGFTTINDTIADGETMTYSVPLGVYTVTETSPGAGWATVYTATPGANTGSNAVVSLFPSNNALPSTTSGPISGQVYQDFNSNGQIDGGTVADRGIANAVITAYDPNGTVVGSATTDTNGDYSLTPTGSGPYRLELTNLPAGYYPSSHGADNDTSAQFVTTNGGASDVDFGVNSPADYSSQSNPFVVSNVYVNGDSNTTAPTRAVVKFSYNNSGTSPTPTTLATKAQVGSTWGLAYARTTETIYAAAFLKRHVGMGPSGLGAIYAIDANGGTPTLFADLAALGADIGTVESNSARGLGAPSSPNRDASTFAQIGKVGLGDIDISDDDRLLYVVSMNDKTLYGLNIPDGALASSNVIPDPGCVGGAWRPFGLKYYHDSIYVGGVCDAQTSQLKTDLQAYVYRFTPGTNTFTQVLVFPLDYPRPNGPSAGCDYPWNPWLDTLSTVCTTAARMMYPQPMLSDIEFDIDGTMILGLNDRNGHQFGYDNYGPTSSNTLYHGRGLGDILRATNNNGAFVLENNATSGSLTSAGANNNQGPGGGEFYYDDDGADQSKEAAVGGLTLLPGRGEVGTTFRDPVSTVEGGVAWLSNTTGRKTRTYELYPGSAAYFGKSAGVGDIELLLDPAPIEIGNRVWQDLNGDGVQDANEPGLANVAITLHWLTNTVTTTTDANGLYYFSVSPYTAYTITIAPTQTALAGLSLTAPNVEAANGARFSNDPFLDVRDSDAVLINAIPAIFYTTGGLGRNNHGLDFGFVQPVNGQVDILNTAPPILPAQFGDRVWIESDSDGDANTGMLTPVAGMVITATNGSETYTTTTDAAGYYSFTVPSGTYTVTHGAVPSSYGAVEPSATPGGNSENGDAGSYQQAGNPDQSHQNNTTVSVASGEANWQVDFAFTPLPAQFGDRVFLEDDGDGLANTGVTTPIAGMVITATNGSETYTTTIDVAGYYSFTVPAGSYTVTYGSVPSSYGAVEPSATPGGSSESGAAGVYQESGNPDQSHVNNTTVTVAAGEANWLIDFAFTSLPAQFGDRVLVESDGDGLANTGVITPVVGMVITATNGTAVYTTTTNAVGYYSFTVPSGTYTTTYGSIPASYGVVVPSTVISGAESGNAGGYQEPGNPDANHGQHTTVTLVGGEANWRVDFLFTPLPPNPRYSLGNRLWIDDGAGNPANRDNGLYNTGEAPVAEGVVVELLNITGTVIATTTTDLAGYYRFDGLPAGDYRVRIPATEFQPGGKLVGLNSSSGYTDTFTTGENNLDHGDDDTTDGVTSAVITLGASNPLGDVDGGVVGAGANGATGDAYDNLTVDFGFVPPLAQFGDRVWIESDNDGDANTGTIIPVVSMVVTATNGTNIYTTTTNAAGYYSFTVPAGTYTVTYGSVPASYGAVEPSATPGGNSESGNAGSYQETGNPDQSHVNNTTVTVAAGEANWLIDFAFTPLPAQFGDRVWIESDNDGDANTGTITPIMGMVITATDGTNVYTTTTDAAGYYSFTVPAGSYTVTYGSVPSSYGAVEPSATPGGNSENGNAGSYQETGNPDQSHANNTTVTVAAGEANWQVDFAFFGLNPTIALVKYTNGYDADTPTGPYLAIGAVVTWTYDITNTGNITLTDVTLTDDQEGSINCPLDTLLPGQGMTCALTGTATVGQYANTAVVTGTPTVGPVYPVTDTNPSHYFGVEAGIGDRVWYDDDHDGVQDANETGVPDITVELLDSNGGILSTTTTSSSGYYSFTGLTPAVYSVRFVTSTLPGGYLITQPDQGSDDSADSDADPTTGETSQTTLSANEFDPTWDMGIYRPTASVGDLVWEDLNHNGVQDPNEPGISGVTVTLTDRAGLTQTVTTDANGNYTFTNLTPNEPYTVTFAAPDGYEPTVDNVGDDATDSDGEQVVVTLDPGEHDPTIDRGFWRPAGIGDRVWYDDDRNGVQDASETGVENVTVELLDANGQVIDTTTTDSSGWYSFTNLATGDYRIRFVTSTLPEGYILTQPDQGSDDSADSDADPTTGETSQTTLSAGEFDPTWDAGIYRPTASVGDLVWEDLNHNGTQDPNEPGIAGVTVTLTDRVGLTQTVTTDANGNYIFTDLTPNEPYTVTFSTPDGYEPTVDNVGDDATDSDGEQVVVTLDPGEHDPTIDRGFWRPAGIGDRVWYDDDRDGVQDANESGVENITVELLNSNGQVIDTTTTGSSGYYSFTALPTGNYSIRFVTSTLPDGYLITQPDQGSDNSADSDADPTTGETSQTTLAADEFDPTWDMGIYRPMARVGDLVWEDLNHNGTQDPNEPGIAGVTVTLTDRAGLTQTVTTDANGNYIFTDPTPGEPYTVTFATPDGYEPTVDNVGDDATDSDGEQVVVTLESGEYDPTIDRGFWRPAGIGDRVWYDDDRDGVQDPSETGVSGITVELLDSNGQVIDSTTTDSSGWYSFTGLVTGDYNIRFVTNTLPNGYVVSPQDNSGDDTTDSDANPATGETVQTNLQPGEYDPTWDMGIYRPTASVGDLVWEDLNHNGTQDPNEPGIAGVTVTLTDSAGLTQTVTTDASGNYTFTNLTPSEPYTVTFTTPAGYEPTVDNVGDDATDSDGEQVVVTLDPGEHNPTIDRGFWRPAGIGDRVWYDDDRDGVQDASETGVENVTVELLDVNGAMLLTTTTDASGWYSFTGLVTGDYRIRFVTSTLPDGYVLTTPDQGSDDATDSDADPTTGDTSPITLSADEFDPTWDMGIYRPTASVGDLVWEDLNQNGTQDPNEPGIAGVTVTLTDRAGMTQTVTTDANGNYIFTDLTPNEPYTVTFTTPDGYEPTVDNVGDDATDSDGAEVVVTLDPGEHDPTIDRGFWRPAGIGDRVWYDNDRNGVQDANETGVENIIVELLDVNGTMLLTTTTDASGWYSFTALPTGDYAIHFVLDSLPSGYVVTPQDNSGDDATDSDADPTTGATVQTNLQPGEYDPTWDMGIYRPIASVGDLVWEDLNHNGIQDPNEPGIAGVTVTLTDRAGLTQTVTTDANGNYIFTNLTPNEPYTVTFETPDGYEPTVDNVGDDATDSDGEAVVVTLEPGEHDPTIDRGFWRPAGIGDRVWYDNDRNGVQDASEIGVENVTVELLDSNGQVIDLTTTDSSGWYSFTVLVTGDYRIRFVTSTLPTDYVLIMPDSGDDSADSDANPTTGETIQTNLQPGEYDPTWDAGIYRPTASVGDRVWEDLNHNGAQEPNEPGIAGVTVTLTDRAGLTQTVTTDANGNYIFTDLTPNEPYTVTFSTPDGYEPTVDNVGDDATDSDGEQVVVTLDPGEHDPTIDRGFWRPAGIGDRVWYDDDRDGVQDANETGVENVTVELLDVNGAMLLTTTTDASGWYSFTDLVIGDYRIRFVTSTLPDGYVISPQDNSGDDATDSDANPTTGATVLTNLQPGEYDPMWDAGIYQPTASVGDLVWEDLNHNGVQDPTEPGISGVTVTLTDHDGLTQTVTTDANGNYTFTDLTPNMPYTVTFATPDGYEPTVDNVGDDATDSDGAEVVVTLDPGEHNPTIDRGFWRPAGIGDRVWYDDDRDGVQDANETGVENITVELLDSNGQVIDTTTTGSSGYYSFTGLVTGDYRIRFVTSTLPDGYVISPHDNSGDDATDSDANPTTGETVQTNLQPGEYDPTWDAGIYRPTASVGDLVWEDLNHNGAQEPNEPGIAGVTVTLTDRVGLTQTVTTDANGNYIFTDLTPNEPYTVTFSTPDGYEPTVDNVGDDATDSDGEQVVVTLDPGEHDPTIDRGFWRPAGIGDRVWYDNDRDGVQDATETGVSGVSVELLDSNGQVIDSTTTDSSGWYSFTDLVTSDYSIHFVTSTLPTGYVLTTPDSGDDSEDSDADPTTGATVQTNLQPGEYDPTWDAGILLPPVNLGNFVWFDGDRDGSQDSNELGVPGSIVLLDLADGSRVTTTTDLTGYYTFTNLAPNQLVTVTFHLPNGYSVTTPNNSDDALDSDPASNGVVVVNLGTTDDYTIDAGLIVAPVVVGDRAFVDVNRDGVQDQNDQPLPGVLLHLTKADGTPAADLNGNPLPDRTTDANGHYRFENLPPGQYTVSVLSVPTGYRPTTPNVGVPTSDSSTDKVTSSPATGTTAQPGGADLTLDFGFVPVVNLGNLVWLDSNNNGQVDGGEPGIPHVTVQLFRDGDDPTTATPVATDVTDENGTYLFANLEPGRYYVYIPTPPEEYPMSSTVTDSADNGEDNDDNGSQATPGAPVTSPLIELAVIGEPVNDGDGENGDQTVDFGFIPLLDLGNQVWHDANNNGQIDDDEVGIANVTVQLFREGDDPTTATPIATDVTDENGSYLFANLEPGVYFVYIPTPPRQYPVSTTPTDDGDNGEDNDDNGAQDQLGQPVRSPLIDLAVGAEPTNDGDDANGDLTVDFGFFLPASLGDLVWFDWDEDGVQDAWETGKPGTLDERGVPNASVTLYNAMTNERVATTTTDTHGRYRFDNLPPGDYVVALTIPAGYLLTTPDQGDNEAFDSDVNPATLRTPVTTLVSGEHNPTLDMGLFLPDHTQPAAIGDRVWYDADQDGMQDADETGVPGVTVTLRRGDDSMVATTITSVDGMYLFNSLPPGDYSVTFTPPTGYIISPQDAGDNDSLDSDVDPNTGRTAVTTLKAGEVDLTWDLGLWLSTPPAAIGDRVWYDTNADGVQDADETGVPGVLVTLYRADDTLVATTRTNADGNYRFINLPPGDYYLRFAPRPGYISTAPDQGGDDVADSDVDLVTLRTPTTTLDAGKADMRWGYGIFILSRRTGDLELPANLGNRVWEDKDQDGLQGDPANEPAMGGVTVKLYDSDGQLLATDITDANGEYHFPNLLAGAYYVEFVLPDGYVITSEGSEPMSDIDSNANPQTGRTPIQLLEPGEINLTLDAGVYRVPTNLGDEDEPTETQQIYLPLISR